MERELVRILENIECEVEESFKNGEMSYESRNTIKRLIDEANLLLAD